MLPLDPFNIILKNTVAFSENEYRAQVMYREGKEELPLVDLDLKLTTDDTADYRFKADYFDLAGEKIETKSGSMNVITGKVTFDIPGSSSPEPSPTFAEPTSEPARQPSPKASVQELIVREASPFPADSAAAIPNELAALPSVADIPALPASETAYESFDGSVPATESAIYTVGE